MWLIKLKLGLGKIKHKKGKHLDEHGLIWEWDGKVSSYARNSLMFTDDLKVTVHRLSPLSGDCVMKIELSDKVAQNIPRTTNTCLVELNRKLLDSVSETLECKLFGGKKKPEMAGTTLVCNFIISHYLKDGSRNDLKRRRNSGSVEPVN